jgi:hypothetical protein
MMVASVKQTPARNHIAANPTSPDKHSKMPT